LDRPKKEQKPSDVAPDLARVASVKHTLKKEDGGNKPAAARLNGSSK
jgi:hypothetical protein